MARAGYLKHACGFSVVLLAWMGIRPILAADERPPRVPQAQIVASGNTRGIFEPCRCPTNPYGGVARRVTWVIQQRVKYPSLLLVDSGDVLDSDISQAWGDLFAWGYRLCGYDAVALGSRDVMYSRKVGAERFKASGIPWVCGFPAGQLIRHTGPPGRGRIASRAPGPTSTRSSTEAQ